MADIIHRVGIRAPSTQVYRALTTIDGLAGWWTEETSGAAEPGSTLKFHFRDPKGQSMGGFDMQVVGQTPAQVQWKCVDGPEDWVGTDLSFDLSEEDGYTIVKFGHRNWREVTDFMGHCSTKWGVFMMSLKDLVEQGRGQPSPRDVKIDSWN